MMGWQWNILEILAENMKDMKLMVAYKQDEVYDAEHQQMEFVWYLCCGMRETNMTWIAKNDSEKWLDPSVDLADVDYHEKYDESLVNGY